MNLPPQQALLPGWGSTKDGGLSIVLECELVPATDHHINCTLDTSSHAPRTRYASAAVIVERCRTRERAATWTLRQKFSVRVDGLLGTFLQIP